MGYGTVGVVDANQWVWDTNTLSWVRAVQSDVSGTTDSVNIAADAVGLARQAQLPTTLGQKAMAASLAIAIASDQSSIPVTGTFWQATQPISAVSLPLPTGASTAAKQPALGTAGAASADVITVQGIAGGTTVPISGTVTATASGTQDTNLTQIAGAAVSTGNGIAGTGTPRVTIASDNTAFSVNLGTIGTAATATNQATGNTSLSSIDGKITACNTGAVTISGALPTGAATIGAVNLAQYTPVAGRVPIDGSGVTQPVSGTITANAGTGPFPVSDNSGSLTVDAPVGTPVAARLSDGSAFLTTTGGRLSVDASGVAVPVTDNAGSLTVDGTVSSSTLSSVQNIDDDSGYADGDVDKVISQTPDGRLRVAIAALVTDTTTTYLDGNVRSLSLTTEGRLRVATVSESNNFTTWSTPEQYGSDMERGILTAWG